jgi:hypothetical protein
MKNVKLLLIGFTLLLGLTNCSSSFFALSPDEESNLEMGRQIVEKEDDIAFSSLSFEESTDREYILNLFVYNKSGEKIIVDPKEIYFRIYDEDRKPMNKTNYYAIDPENQIKKIESDMKSRNTEHDVSTGLNIVFSLFNTIVDLADDEDNDVEEVAENAIIFTGNQINEEVSYSNDIDFLKNQKSYWQNSVLRITELNSEESID